MAVAGTLFYFRREVMPMDKLSIPRFCNEGQ
jgi:hypothetical protein